MTDQRVGAAGGIVFVVLSIAAGAILPKPPAADASAAELGRYFSGHHERIETAGALAALAAVALLAFVVCLAERLSADRFAGRLALAGGTVLVSVGVLGALVQAMIAQVSSRISGDTRVLAFAVDEATFYIAPAIGAIALTAAVARGAAAAGLPSWIAGFALLIAAVGVVAGVGQLLTTSSAMSAIGFAGFVLTVLWVAAVSVVLLRQERTVRTVSPVAAAA